MSSATPEQDATVKAPSAPAVVIPEKKREEDPDEKAFREMLLLAGQVAPHIAQAASKNAEQETIRHENELRLWSRPFLFSIATLGSGVLILAGMAIGKDKPDLAVTIIGYLLTYLGGIGTGRQMNRKPG